MSEGGENIPRRRSRCAPGAARLFNLRWAPTVAGSLNAHVHVISDDPVNGDRLMPVTGNAILPPVTAWSPSSFNESANVGDVLHRSLHIENNGGSDLNFSSLIGLNSGATGHGRPQPRAQEGRGGHASGRSRLGRTRRLRLHLARFRRPGGPGVQLGRHQRNRHADRAAQATTKWSPNIPIGFPFPFYGSTFSTVNANSNGCLSFTSTVSAGSYNNYPLPSTSAAENLLAMFHDDLTFSSTGHAYYYNDGTRFILSYVGVPRLTSGGPYTFQIILYRNGRIVYQYLDMQGTRLNESTIGMQNAAQERRPDRRLQRRVRAQRPGGRVPAAGRLAGGGARGGNVASGRLDRSRRYVRCDGFDRR